MRSSTLRLGSPVWPLAVALAIAGQGRAGAAFITLSANLTGSQVVPSTASTGTGAATFVLNDVIGSLTGSVTFSNLTSPTAAGSAGFVAGIFSGLPGQNGPSLHPMASAPSGVTAGSFTDLWVGISAANIALLKSGSTYLSISSQAFPGGEIRGQITVVPEPASVALTAVGAAALLGAAWRGRAGRRRG
ncbi:MAG: CHRD domain-containing protein [Isosphaeraceae bacterium]